MSRGVIAIMGSGETAPGMTKVHRQLLSRYENPKVVNLDTPYAFQLNVPQMSAKLENYFKTSLHLDVETLHLGRMEETDELDRALFTRRLAEADYVFAGPGSPSFALEQWSQIPLADVLFDVVERGGTVCFSSAAACTLGAFTAPVYEIYKVGAIPSWLEGLNLLGRFGIDCAVIPHYDNAEGRDYDTSRCYLGESRLAELERNLPVGTSVLGVDEHSALVINFATGTLSVTGRGHSYWRHGNDDSITLSSDSMNQLVQHDSPRLLSRESSIPEPLSLVSEDPVTLGRIALARDARSADAIAQLVNAASQGGGHLIDPADLVEKIISMRNQLRRSGNYQLADQLRDVLHSNGVRINDGDTTSAWSLDASL